MHTLIRLQALSAAAAITLLAGCSGGSAIAPKPASQQGGAHSSVGRMSEVLSSMGIPNNVNANPAHHFKSFDGCPALGPIKYVSDYENNIITIFTGKFAGQAPCGQITSGINRPQLLYVSTSAHDLYVANWGDYNVLVFHRGQITPYNTYTDPSGQYVADVTVAKDGTVIASNYQSLNGPKLGSLSTWIGGPNGGTFVGNFPLTTDLYGLAITVRRNGTVYYSDVDSNSRTGVLWSLSCPAGACGTQTQVAGVSFIYPLGMRFDAEGDLVAIDAGALTADTFELPNPKPKTFPLTGMPGGVDINPLDHHLFTTDLANNDAAEYSYPSGKLIGTVAGNPGANLVGIAVDPGHVR